MATTASIIGALAAVAGTGYGIYSSEKAKDEQKKALARQRSGAVSNLTDLSPTNDILKELLGYTPQPYISVGKREYGPSEWSQLQPRNQQEVDWLNAFTQSYNPSMPYGSIGSLSGVSNPQGSGGSGPTKLGSAMNMWNDPMGILGKPGSTANWVLNPVGTAISTLLGGTKKKKVPKPMVAGSRMVKTSRGVFEDPRFTPDEALTPLQQTVRDYIYGETQNRFQNEYPFALGDSAMNAYLNPEQGPLGSSIKVAEEAMRTGFRPDLDAIRREAMRLYREEDLPYLKEQFAPQTSTFATDFLGATGRELGAIESRLGALAAEYDDKAGTRKLQAAELYPKLREGNVNLPLALADNFLKLGTNLENLSPAVRILDQLGYLSGLGTQQRFVQPGYSPESGSSSFDSIAASIPALAKSATDLYSAFSSGGNTTNTINVGTGLNPTAGASFLNTGLGSGSLYQPTSQATNWLSGTGAYPVQLFGGASGF